MESTKILVDGELQSHCPEHFPAKLDWKGQDKEGQTMWTCPEGHLIIEES